MATAAGLSLLSALSGNVAFYAKEYIYVVSILEFLFRIWFVYWMNIHR